MGATREHRLLQRYRAEAEAFFEVPFDLELLREHMKRHALDEHRRMALDMIIYELRKRIKRFRDIEPEHYDALEKRLQEQYQLRDHRNAQVSKASGTALMRKANDDG